MGTSAGKRKRVQKGGSGGFDPKIKDLQCFLNQPNINMVLPWLYEIYKNIVKPDSSKQRKKRGGEDPVLRDLECFFNQPNINMAIPWIYEIRNAVKEGGGGGGIEWEDRTRGNNNDDIVMEEG